MGHGNPPCPPDSLGIRRRNQGIGITLPLAALIVAKPSTAPATAKQTPSNSGSGRFCGTIAPTPVVGVWQACRNYGSVSCEEDGRAPISACAVPVAAHGN